MPENRRTTSLPAEPEGDSTELQLLRADSSRHLSIRPSNPIRYSSTAAKKLSGLRNGADQDEAGVKRTHKKRGSGRFCSLRVSFVELDSIFCGQLNSYRPLTRKRHRPTDRLTTPLLHARAGTAFAIVAAPPCSVFSIRTGSCCRRSRFCTSCGAGRIPTGCGSS